MEEGAPHTGGKQSGAVPLIGALKAYDSAQIVRLHMPGHGGRSPFGGYMDYVSDWAAWDVTEIPGTDDLHQPEGPILRAQQNAARLYGAARSFFLVNGATAGIQAMLGARLAPGQKILLGRDCHRSAINACALWGLDVGWAMPERGEGHMPAVVTERSVQEALERHADARALLITYPNYYGLCPDLPRIARLCAQHGIALLVDAAHGAHLGFHDALPPSPAACGAAAFVVGAHKTLPSLTQSAMLHVMDEELCEGVSRVLRAVTTSSPSYLLMASLDVACAFLERGAAQAIERQLADAKRLRVAARRAGLSALDKEAEGTDGIWRVDLSRVVLDVSVIGMSGYEAQAYLRSAHGVQAEMGDDARVVLLLPMGGLERAALERVEHGLEDMARKASGKPRLRAYPQMPAGQRETVRSPREVLFSAWETLPLERAAGRVLAEAVGVYPPGIALCCPGERFERADVEYLRGAARLGARLFGCDGGRVHVLIEPDIRMRRE